MHAEHLVKVAHQLHGIAYLVGRKIPEQLTDADVGRRPHGGIRLHSQIFVKEKAGTLVGKYYGSIGQTVAILIV